MGGRRGHVSNDFRERALPPWLLLCQERFAWILADAQLSGSASPPLPLS
jgi:hypothetical protein